MAIHVIRMPDIGEGIAEVEVVEWHVQPGDTVHEDQVLAEVMTDKATVEIPSPVAGKVLALSGEVGEVLAVGTELIRLEVAGQEEGGSSAGATEQVGMANPPATAGEEQAGAVSRPGSAGEDQAAAARQGSASEDQAEKSPKQQQLSTASAQAATPDAGAPLRSEEPAIATHGRPSGPPEAARKAVASPAVRRRAWELGVELYQVPATGAGGRVMQSDLDAYAARRSASSSPGSPLSGDLSGVRGGERGYTSGIAAGGASSERNDEEQVPVVGLRRKIAQKMQDAKRHIPHFTYVEEVDVTELEALRKRLNNQWGAERGRLTLLPFLVRALVLGVRQFPQVNARFDDEAGIVTRYGAVHVGIATPPEAGLMVPVLRHAEARDLWSVAAEIARLAQDARSGKATREELSGSTVTITSLGALGGIVSTPVINHPEVAIVGVNRMVPRPVVHAGAVVVRDTMNLSSSFDHRVVDGLYAAEFIQALRGYLECPATLFVQ